MTRQPHDQFAKEYLEELLTPLGRIKKSQKVKSEVQEIDVWFEPVASDQTQRLPLGLLAQMATQAALFEPFRNAPSDIEIRSCLLKLYAVHGQALRQAKRAKTATYEAEMPILWILTPTFSPRMIEGFGAVQGDPTNWVQGVYFLPYFLKTGIIAIHQLPSNEETLWLRVLGKGGTQKRAVEELVDLPTNNPFKENLLEILANWRKNLELRDNLTREDQEVIMNLSPAYIQQCQDWKQEGIQLGRSEGIQQGKQEIIENLLRVRFGVVDEGLLPGLLGLPTEELTRLLLSLSREELVGRFGED